MTIFPPCWLSNSLSLSTSVGNEEELQFITDEDIASGKGRIVPEEERKEHRKRLRTHGPDAVDIKAVVRRRGLPISSDDLDNPGGLSGTIMTGSADYEGEDDLVDGRDAFEDKDGFRKVSEYPHSLHCPNHSLSLSLSLSRYSLQIV